MMKRLGRIIAVAFATGVLAVGTASGQQTLGFTIDPTEGRPGDTVAGQVTPADVAEHCVTELEPFQAQFNAVLEGPYANGAAEGELFDRFFPTPDFIFTNHDQTAYVLIGFTVLGIAFSPEIAATALPQTFVMTFADIATQQPLGEIGHFDPVTGVGSVTVPSLDPGVYPVAATCVRPTLDLDLLEAGIRRSGAFLQSIGVPVDPNSPEFEAFAQDFLGSSQTGFDLLIEFLTAIGPTLIQNIVTPGALGVQLFTILPPPLNHFQCYEVRDERFPDVDVTLADRFGALAATVREATDICAPADKNGEDPTAPGDPDYLTTYEIKTRGRFEPVKGQTVVNQFGTLTVDVEKPRSLLVPSAFSAAEPPSSPAGAFVNHFTCYDVDLAKRSPRFNRQRVTVQTPFETVELEVRKPERLCVPTNKNGEDPTAPNDRESLLCYETKERGRNGDDDDDDDDRRGRGGSSARVFVNNQFGQQAYRLDDRAELCVPSEVNPTAPTTTTTSTSTTSTSTTTSTTQAPTTTTSTTTTTTAEPTTTTSTSTTTTTTAEPTTTTTSSTTTTTVGSPSGAFL